MFTGIIRHVGTVQGAETASGGQRLSIDVGPLAEGLSYGDSVAVSGVCLTVAEISGAAAQFDVAAQTLETTTLGDRRTGEKVNLEPALRASDGLDGHLVQGHVDGAAEVADIRRGDQWDITFRAPEELMAGMVAKGSVAVDGVSLTLADVQADRFRVALIPTTLAETTLADLKVGNRVNIETDLIGKYLHKYLLQLADKPQGGLTLEQLRSAGFC